MRRELRRYSSIGNCDGILLLCSKMFTGNREKMSSIRTSCSFIIGVNINVNCAEMLFEDLGLVDIQGDICISKGLKYDKLDESTFIQKLCEICFKNLINENMINEELIKFDEEIAHFYIPTSAFRLESSILRNLLKELSALKLVGTKFYISQEYEHLFVEVKRKKKTLSQEELMKKLEDEQKIGEDGEAFVLEYEKKRLNADKINAKNIKQISLIDVAAGYDIISYHDNTFRNRRYIEVKTYKGNEHFYWSSNEIESARLRREDYYIYLVKHSEIKNEGYKPLMIADPYINLQEDDSWKALPDSYFIERVNKDDNPSLGKNEGFSQSAKFGKTTDVIDIKPSAYEIVNDIAEEYKFVDFLPIYSIKAACGYNLDFDNIQNGGHPDPDGWIRANGLGFPISDRHFVIEAKGDSMLPDIRKGDLCVFAWYRQNNGGGGTREGDIVLTQCRNYYDPDYGGRYTIKKYHSEWKEYEDGTREHVKIELIPLNTAFKKIELSEDDQPITIGIFKCVIKRNI